MLRVHPSLTRLLPGLLIALAACGGGDGPTTTTPPAGVSITSISPSQMVEGQAATITGSGFNTAAGGTTVTVDGQAATVTAVTATQVTFTVPAGDCRPAHDAQVVATVGTTASPAKAHPMRPAAFTSMAVGEQQILKGAPCLQFAAGSAAEAYLIGVQNVSGTGSSTMPATLSAEAGASASGAPAAAILPEPRLSSASLSPARLEDALRSVRRSAHDRAEARLRGWERERFAGIAGTLRRPGSGGARRAVIPGSAAVGDTFAFRVPNINATNLCTDAPAIRAVVRRVGTRGIWVEDVDNPAGGFTAADYQGLSDVFDNQIYATDVQYFGEPTDLDANGRIVILVSKEVNKAGGILGFVFSGDLVPQDNCAQSNYSEVYYAIAPDPTGAVGDTFDLEDARREAPALIAHEFSHILQFGVRIYSPTTTHLQTVWEGEGQAMIAEEVVGHAVTGRQPGQNYGLSVAFPQAEFPWYQQHFVDLAVYYGFQTQSARATTAPEECTWLSRPSAASPQPCLGGRSPYGVSWSFLRYITDQYGPSFPGGEAGLHRKLVDAAGQGFPTISAVTGQPIDVLLARWAAALYVDGRVATPQLSFTSWNMRDVFDGLVNTAQLTPRPVAFSTFSQPVNVRGGSSAYFRLSGSNRPATAVKARAGAGGALPADGQVWVVRLQ